MDGEPEYGDTEVKNDRERQGSADSHTGNNSPIDDGKEEEGVSAEAATSGQDEENVENIKVNKEPSVEEAVTSEPEDSCGDEFPGMDNIRARADMDVKINEVNQQPLFHEESVVFEINSNDDDGPPRLHLETPQGEDTSAPQDEEDGAEEEEATVAPVDKEDINYEEYLELLQQLHVERDKASQRNSQLQMKLAEYFRKKSADDTQLEREMLVSEQLQECEKYFKILSDLKQQISTESETAEQQAHKLSLRSQEKMDKVENEWRAFVALKQDVAVTVLSRWMGKQAAQAKVESTLVTEQLRQDELVQQRLKHIKLRMKIQRLEAELRDREEHARDPLQLQYEKLQAERLEMKKQTEKQNEEALKMQKKISSSLELLSNIKEKLFWSQMEVQAKREQLAEVEGMVARKRDLLTRTKQARNGLQRDNQRLKESPGLLGNRILLRDFEDTVDRSNHLQQQLENSFINDYFKTHGS